MKAQQWKFAGEHQHGIADFQPRVHHGLAVGRQMPFFLVRAEGFFVKLNRLHAVRDDEVRGERVESIGNRFGHNFPFV